MKKQVPILLVALLTLFSGCAEHIIESRESANEDKRVPDFIQVNVFDQSCNNTFCHGGGVTPDLRADVAYDNIVGKSGTQSSLSFIDPGNPNNSYLYLKVLGTGISGQRMPRGQPALPQARIDDLETWISDGAPAKDD